MRIALVDSNPRPAVYPFPLLKLGAWRRSLGDECKIFNFCLPAKGEYDEIWITTLFTYNIYEAVRLTAEATKRAKKVRVGGVAATLLPDYFQHDGVEIHMGLHPEAEKYAPDYSLLEEEPDYSITYASRGCVRKCKFCMVSRLEPKFRNRRNWIQDLNPRAKRILFYDNNWLAKGIKDLKYDARKIQELQDSGQISEVDFNQALDARLMTEEKADILKELKIYPLRFGFDSMALDGVVQRVIRMMAERGWFKFQYYTLYNYKDTPEDLYYRIKQSPILKEKYNIEVTAVPMRYHPILDVASGRDYIGRHWSAQALKGFMAIISRHSAHGQISTVGGSVFSAIEEFEYWFGRDEKEFVRLINYKHIRLLASRKKGDLRLRRAAIKQGGMSAQRKNQL